MITKTMKIFGLLCLWSLVFLFTGCHDEDYDDYKIPLNMEGNSRFEEYMLQYDLDGDGYVSIQEARNVTELDVSGMSLTSMKFIQYFTELERLDCSRNSLSSFDVSKNVKLKELILNMPFGSNGDFMELDFSANEALEIIECHAVFAKSIDLTHNHQLRKLHATFCFFDNLDLSGCEKLESLSLERVHFSQPISLNVNNNRLKTIVCKDTENIKALNLGGCAHMDSLHCHNLYGYDGEITIDVAGCTALKYLNLTSGNYQTPDISTCVQLKELQLEGVDVDISHCKSLQYLQITDSPSEESAKVDVMSLENFPELEVIHCYNQMKTLLVNNCRSLKVLHCNSVGLQVLEIDECPALEELECAYNQITTLLPGKIEQLKSLICNHNLLTQLDVSKNLALVSLNCAENEGITELDMRHNKNLQSLYCGDERTPDLKVYLRKGYEPHHVYLIKGTVVYVE